MNRIENLFIAGGTGVTKYSAKYFIVHGGIYARENP